MHAAEVAVPATGAADARCSAARTRPGSSGGALRRRSASGQGTRAAALPLRKGICPGRPDQRLDDPRAIAAEHVVERRRELAVAIADQEAELAGAFTQIHEQVTGLLGGPQPGGVCGDAQDMHAARLDLYHEEHLQALEERGVNVQEIARRIPAAWEARNCRQVGDARRGAGVSPVPLEKSIERLTGAIASSLDTVMVGRPAAARDRLPASSPDTLPRCPFRHGPGEGC